MSTNRSMASGFYTIDAKQLVKPAKKPFHLDQRFSQGLSVSIMQKSKIAELRREAILEERRNKCRETISHVKRIAKEVRERREHETSQLENDQCPRTKDEFLISDHSSGHSNESHSESAHRQKKIASFKPTLKEFKALGLPSSSSPKKWPDLNELSRSINQGKVIVLTTKVLHKALKVNCRHRAHALLTSYVLLVCPHEVLQNVNGPDEMQLYESAQEMLKTFEIWIENFDTSAAPYCRHDFVNAWKQYYELFEVWKAKDRAKHLNDMIDQYKELSDLRQTVIDKNPGDPSADSQLKEQLEQVKSKIEQLGGSDALERLIITPSSPLMSQEKTTPSPPSTSSDEESIENIYGLEESCIGLDCSSCSSNESLSESSHHQKEIASFKPSMEKFKALVSHPPVLQKSDPNSINGLTECKWSR